jgi:hypothetical protein
MKKLAITLIIATSVTGCMSFTPSPFQEGSVVLAGDSEGVRSLMDGLNGLVSNGKTQDPLGDSAHWQHRKQQEQEKTRRRVGLFNKLTKGGR